MQRKHIKDAYEMWVDSGKWPEIRDFLKKSFQNRLTQKEICRRLDIHETTFIELKKKHPEIQQAIFDGKLDLRVNCINNIVKLANGYEEVIEDQIITDGGDGKKQQRKIHRTIRKVGPDFKSNVYLLSKTFGPEFDMNYEALKLQREKLEANKEEWTDGQSTKNSD